MPRFKLASKSKSPKLLTTFSLFFIAGLGLCVFFIGRGFMVGISRVNSLGLAENRRVPFSTREAVPGGEGFTDPLVTLVKPTAAYRAETPLAPEVIDTDPVRGNANARARIVLFGDITDPDTRVAWDAVKEVWERHRDEVQLVWKDFPLPTNPEARPLAIAARCAQEQGKFWEFTESVINDQLSVINDGEAAQQIGLDSGEFERCLSSPAPIALVNRGMEEAQALEVDAVPTVFVGSYRLTGAVTEEVVSRLVNDIIDQ